MYQLHIFSQKDKKGQDEAQKEKLDETEKALRELAGRLRASLWTVPFYDTLARLEWVPKRDDVLEASRELVGWSNSLYGSCGMETRTKRQKIIAERLGISEKIGEVGATPVQPPNPH